jgi:hypothetical protein
LFLQQQQQFDGCAVCLLLLVQLQFVDVCGPVASLLIVVVCYSCMQSSVDLLLAVEWLGIGGNNPGSWDETLLRSVYLVALLLRSVDVLYNIELDKL